MDEQRTVPNGGAHEGRPIPTRPARCVLRRAGHGLNVVQLGGASRHPWIAGRLVSTEGWGFVVDLGDPPEAHPQCRR